jgi:hypothetical protein
MGSLWISQLTHQIIIWFVSSRDALRIINPSWGNFCAICAWLAGHGLGWWGLGAGAATAASGTMGGDKPHKPRKVLPFPGGGWLGTDGRIHYGKDVGVGPFDVKANVDTGAAPGSDPRGPIVDANYDVKVKVGPVTVTDVKGNASVGISKPVQDMVSSPYGGQGTQSGAWLKQFMNEP